MVFLNRAGNLNNYNILTNSNIRKLLKQGYIKKSKKYVVKNLTKKDKNLINFLILNNIINYSVINKTQNILKQNFSTTNLLYLKYFDNKPILF